VAGGAVAYRPRGRCGDDFSIVRRRLTALLFTLVAVLAFASTAPAQDLSAYMAKAGMLPICVDPKRPEAEFFHVADAL
jgi:hypothetical protein